MGGFEFRQASGAWCPADFGFSRTPSLSFKSFDWDASRIGRAFGRDELTRFNLLAERILSNATTPNSPPATVLFRGKMGLRRCSQESLVNVHTLDRRIS